MTKKDEELEVFEELKKWLEQAIAYKKGDKTKATSKITELDFEKELEKSVNQINRYTQGDESGVEIKKDESKK